MNSLHVLKESHESFVSILLGPKEKNQKMLFVHKRMITQSPTFHFLFAAERTPSSSHPGAPHLLHHRCHVQSKSLLLRSSSFLIIINQPFLLCLHNVKSDSIYKVIIFLYRSSSMDRTKYLYNKGLTATNTKFIKSNKVKFQSCSSKVVFLQNLSRVKTTLPSSFTV